MTPTTVPSDSSADLPKLCWVPPPIFQPQWGVFQQRQQMAHLESDLECYLSLAEESWQLKSSSPNTFGPTEIESQCRNWVVVPFEFFEYTSSLGDPKITSEAFSFLSQGSSHDDHLAFERLWTGANILDLILVLIVSCQRQWTWSKCTEKHKL